MDKSSTEKNDALMPKTPTVDFVQTTTLPSDAKPFSASTVSDSEKNEFTDTASRSHIWCLLEEMDEATAERLATEFLASWECTIAGSSVHGISRDLQKKNSNDGSTGPSPEEVEPCD
ncbi:MAG: hypothetical protein J6W09_00680 [Bacteroidales bacterium]|nr:hypothetical protein [Bacteroidales bacterium]